MSNGGEERLASGSDDYLTDLIRSVRGRLLDYLQIHGIEPDGKGMIQCIHPDHNDSNPSMSTKGHGDGYFKCFGCGAVGNIFHAAQWLDNKPYSGVDWVEESVYFLADKMGMQYERRELTETQKQQIYLTRLYETVYNVLIDTMDMTHAVSRGWSEASCKEMGVGTVDWTEFKDEIIKRTGSSVKALEQSDIRRQLFSTDMLTFAVKDEYGRCVGFASRNMKWEKGKSFPKYINTANHVQIYNKSTILYGMNNVRRDNHIYVFEGYADLMTAYDSGVRNCVAVGGTALTRYHVDWLESLGARVTICLDNDENGSGQTNTTRVLDEYFAGRTIPVTTIQLPIDEGETSSDPDTYISKHGADKFRELPELSSFKWRLEQFDYKASPEDTCEKMIPLIVNEESGARRWKMVNQLSEATGIDKQFIKEDLDSIMNRENAESKQVKSDLIYKLQRDIKFCDDPAAFAETFASQFRENSSSKMQSTFLHTETLEFVDELKRTSLESSDELPGHATGYVESFDKWLDGIPKANRMITFAAEPNVGKSAIVVNLAWQIAKRNENVIVLVMTIDDTRDLVVPKWISIESGIPINHVLHPNRFINKERADYNEVRSNLQKGWITVKDAIADGRIDIKDASQGSDLNFAEAWIQHVQKKNPDKDIVFVLDNFHKLSGSATDLRTKFLEASSRIQLMKSKYGITFICTAETRKPMSNRITLNDLAETKKIEYDNDAIILVHNEMHTNPQNPSTFWTDKNEIEERSRKPVLELMVAKNKISSFKGMMHLNFQPETCRLFEGTTESPNEPSTPQEPPRFYGGNSISNGKF